MFVITLLMVKIGKETSYPDTNRMRYGNEIDTFSETKSLALIFHEHEALKNKRKQQSMSPPSLPCRHGFDPHYCYYTPLILLLLLQVFTVLPNK